MLTRIGRARSIAANELRASLAERSGEFTPPEAEIGTHIDSLLEIVGRNQSPLCNRFFATVCTAVVEFELLDHDKLKAVIREAVANSK